MSDKDQTYMTILKKEGASKIIRADDVPEGAEKGAYYTVQIEWGLGEVQSFSYIEASVQTGAYERCSDYVKVAISQDGQNWKIGIVASSTRTTASPGTDGGWAYQSLDSASGDFKARYIKMSTLSSKYGESCYLDGAKVILKSGINKDITNIPAEDEYEYHIEDQPWYAPGFPGTEEIPEGECQSLKSEIDIVLITAADVELKAVAHLLEPYPGRQEILLVYSGPETYYLGKFGEYKTVLTKCRMGAIGEGSVILATEQAQRLWNPKAIIMVGIAFGKDPIKQRIGDVLVASQIISYEQQRVGGKIIERGSISPSNTTLLNRFENVQNWQFDRPDGSSCNLIVGPILSGEKLVDNPNFKAKLFGRFPNAEGGEMEGAGLCAASGRVGTAWILVKSICDWGDGKKHKKHQPLAAAAAASLVHHVLSQKSVLNSIKKP